MTAILLLSRNLHRQRTVSK